MHKENDYIEFFEVSSGIYFVKFSSNVTVKVNTYVTAETVVTYLNSPYTDVTIENQDGNELVNQVTTVKQEGNEVLNQFKD